jgi:hypothetical protein
MGVAISKNGIYRGKIFFDMVEINYFGSFRPKQTPICGQIQGFFA